MGGAPRNPAPRNHFSVRIVKSPGCHCTDALGGTGYRRVPTHLGSTSPFSEAGAPICMYVCMYVYIYIYIYLQRERERDIDICMYMYMYIYMYIDMSLSLSLYIYTYTCVCTYIYIYMSTRKLSLPRLRPALKPRKT